MEQEQRKRPSQRDYGFRVCVTMKYAPEEKEMFMKSGDRNLYRISGADGMEIIIKNQLVYL